MKTTSKLLQESYDSLKEISKTNGDAAIARRNLYYVLERRNRNLPEACVLSDSCGVDGECFTQVSGQGFCK